MICRGRKPKGLPAISYSFGMFIKGLLLVLNENKAGSSVGATEIRLSYSPMTCMIIAQRKNCDENLAHSFISNGLHFVLVSSSI